MIERQMDIPTRDGATTTFITHPEREGPYPVILFYMDAPAIREELRDMARRLAAVGYYVMLPNLYYRSGVMELGSLTGPDAEALRARMFGYMNSLSVPLIMADTEALLGFAEAHFPGVAAAASIYGVRLVTDQPDSPHLVGSKTTAELYIACAEVDHWAPLEMLPPLRQALADAGATAEVELYPGVEHGFAFPQRAVYDRDAAERHWERLFALYRRRLG
jgi:carboxymethylenebutenolidase